MIVKLKTDSILKNYYHISNDKEYVAEVIKMGSSKWYRIQCDNGDYEDFLLNHFLTLKEIRDSKLKNLGIE